MARRPARELTAWNDGPCHKRHWRTLFDGALSDWSHSVVAGRDELASQPDRALEVEFRFLFVLLWGISGIYFAFPGVFNALVGFLQSPSAGGKLQFGDLALVWLSNLHFGRFGWFTEALWTLVGLVPAVLSFTGVFMCCHRLLVRKGAPLSM